MRIDRRETLSSADRLITRRAEKKRTEKRKLEFENEIQASRSHALLFARFGIDLKIRLGFVQAYRVRTKGESYRGLFSTFDHDWVITLKTKNSELYT